MEVSAADKFFGTVFVKAITHKVMAWVWVLLGIGLVAGLGYSAAQLQVPEFAEPSFFGPDFPLQMFMVNNRELFRIGDGDKSVYIVWGVDARDDGDHNNVNDKGTVQFLEDFNPRSAEAQTKGLEFCNKTKHNLELVEAVQDPHFGCLMLMMW